MYASSHPAFDVPGVICNSWFSSTEPGAIVNLPAALIVLLVSAVLYVGIRESARLNSAIVAIKLCAVATVILDYLMNA